MDIPLEWDPPIAMLEPDELELDSERASTTKDLWYLIMALMD